MTAVQYMLGLVILFGLSAFTFFDGFEVDPPLKLLQWTGIIASGYLILCLSIRPLVQIARQKKCFVLKKCYGILSFGFALIHVLIYQLDHNFDLSVLYEDLIKRPHLRFGIISFIFLCVLAVTTVSTIKDRLGNKLWRKLHKLIYPATLLLIFHIGFSTKITTIKSFWFAMIALPLLAMRFSFVSKSLSRAVLASRSKERT